MVIVTDALRGDNMTLDDLKKIQVFQTRTIAEACKDAHTLQYVVSCLQRFYKGDYGEICAEDAGYNNEELADGYGHVLARYKPAGTLTDDIYIEAHFSVDVDISDVDYNNTMIMYCDER